MASTTLLAKYGPDHELDLADTVAILESVRDLTITGATSRGVPVDAVRHRVRAPKDGSIELWIALYISAPHAASALFSMSPREILDAIDVARRYALDATRIAKVAQSLNLGGLDVKLAGKQRIVEGPGGVERISDSSWEIAIKNEKTLKRVAPFLRPIMEGDADVLSLGGVSDEPPVTFDETSAGPVYEAIGPSQDLTVIDSRVIEQEVEERLTLRGWTWDGENPWPVTDEEGHSYTVHMEDESFLARVRQEDPGPGSVLEVRMFVRTTIDSKGRPHPTRFVREVKAHHRRS